MFIKHTRQIITDHIKSNHELIKVVPGTCRYNFYCHSNATHDAITNKHKKMALVVYFDNDAPIIHFINYHKGKYIDNTLGVWCTQHHFYLIRFISKKEFYKVHKIFTAYRKHIKNILPFWLRIFHKLDSI